MREHRCNAKQAGESCNRCVPSVIRRPVARHIVRGLVCRHLVSILFSILLLSFRRRRLLARDMRTGRIDFVAAIGRVRLLSEKRSAPKRRYDGD